MGGRGEDLNMENVPWGRGEDTKGRDPAPVLNGEEALGGKESQIIASPGGCSRVDVIRDFLIFPCRPPGVQRADILPDQKQAVIVADGKQCRGEEYRRYSPVQTVLEILRGIDAEQADQKPILSGNGGIDHIVFIQQITDIQKIRDLKIEVQ